MSKSDDIPFFVEQGVAQLQQGNLQEAEFIFRKVLKRKPRHADANHLLGVVAIQRGHYDLAVRWIFQAIQSNSSVSMFYNNYCYALSMQGRWKDALGASEQAIRLGPDLPEAHYNRGNVLKTLGRQEEAMAAYQRAVQLRPQYAEAYYDIANLLLLSRHDKEAEGYYRQVLELNPQHAGASNNLGVVLANAGKFDAALAAFDLAIELLPQYAEAHNGRANVLFKLSRFEEALLACDQAIEHKPNYAQAYHNRANMLLAIGLIDEAEESCRRALELSQEDAFLHSNLLFVQAARVKLPFNEMLNALRGWDRVHAKEGKLHPLPIRKPVPLLGRRLRIGYVSPHLRSHVVNFFFEPLLSAHEHSCFEIFCYASFLEFRADAVTRRLREKADHWHFVGDKSDAELAQLIYDDGIDILVDLAGHTEANRLKAFTYRPAPVQVSYLGFFAGTGLAAMDYWITDEVLHPRDTRELAVEQIYRLPRCWVCYQPSELAPEVSTRPGSSEEVVFGSFNHLSKLTPETIETWSELLQRLPGSRLLIMARALAAPKVEDMLAEKFAIHGISRERLQLRKGAPYSQYYATFAEVDIVLDPFPRTGGTTTAEALWMGVPVISLAGQRYVERISASKLSAVGLHDLIASSRQEYVEKAVSLAQNPERRTMLRTTLRARMAQSTLCDGEGLARAMETAYQSMWERALGS